MKVIVISDIHGSIEDLEKAIDRLKIEEADKLIILGDFSGYFHSSKDYEIAEVLNNMAGSIIAVKGNCDNEYINEVFNFDLSYTKNITINNILITITHGHIYDKYNLPSDCGKIFLYGHTHIGIIEKYNDKIIANPGSISKPRGETGKTYLIIDEENIILKSLNGEIIKKEKIDKNEKMC